jgi:hypothetical protein
VFENRVLRKIFGPKMYKVKGDGRRLHTKQLHDFYSSPSIILVSNICGEGKRRI